MTLNDFLSDWVQTVEGLGGFAILGLAPRAWKLMECHHDDCRKIGRFRLGHLRLCREHHPDVAAVVIDAEHISETHENLRHRSQ